jgi:CheY-like chemotaxis protein
MRIVVVDDHFQFGYLLGQALSDVGHHVTSVLSPHDLQRHLDVADGRPYDLALVDLEFSRDLGARNATGLAVLQVLAPAGIPSAIYAAETEENRGLFLLAAFRFFDPLAVIDKHQPSERVREFLQQFEDGTLPGPHPSTLRYRTAEGLVPLLDQMIRNTVDLSMWQAIGTHDRRVDIARAAYVSPRTLDKFLARQYDVVTRVEAVLQGDFAVVAAERGYPPANLRSARMIRVHRFAALHRRFFHDPAVRQLIARVDKA